ncbi:MAG: nucleotidyltransferase family protein [SAR324 cluster bacterium]|nr:nucleotidyltransferase family protein [SAR324 cluster bacterium]MCZ6645265.1 nucleotidyltransferase family protein [SAR324 cluster bacterium]
MKGQPVVLLGAGHGKRMGQPKIFAMFEGATFLERILERCRETASPVTLTVDPQFRDKAEALLATLSPPAPVLVEVDGTQPMLQSVRAALRLGKFGEGFWCWPVDAPFITAMGWDQSVETVRGEPEAIWKLQARGETGHPVWFPGWAVPRILAGCWDDGLLGFQEECRDQTHVLILGDEELRDFNSQEQLAAIAPSGEEQA